MDPLTSFSLNTQDPIKSYNLAVWYESQGHTAPAHTYYLKAAELSICKEMSYCSLLRAALCYKQQGSRNATEKVLLENALGLDLSRPEAYYLLSALYERKQDWQNSYLFSHLGLTNSRGFEGLKDIPEYRGLTSLLIQKATAAWWWGKGQECRGLFKTLAEEHWSSLATREQEYVKKSLDVLGITPPLSPS